MLVLSATYTSQLSALVDGDKLCALLDRTIKFLLRSRHISPTLRKDAEILTLIRRKLFEQNPQPQPQPQSTQTGSFSNDRWFAHQTFLLKYIYKYFWTNFSFVLCVFTLYFFVSILIPPNFIIGLHLYCIWCIVSIYAQYHFGVGGKSSFALLLFFHFIFLVIPHFSLFSFLLSIISLFISLK